MILLIVVLMLALFLVVGLSFVYYAESASTGSRIYREAQAPDAADIPPETLLAFAIGQFIYDVPDDMNGALSAMRGHSLARLVYGWNYVGSTNNPMLPDAMHTNNPWDATPNTAYRYMANTTPFDGLGPLRFPQKNSGGQPLLPILPALATLPQNSTLTDYDLVNYMYFAADGGVRDPERPATSSNAHRLDPTQQLLPFLGGFNLPYTYADRGNMFVAAVEANINYVNPNLAPQPALLMPSFVRNNPNLPFSVPSNTKSLQIDPTTPGGFWFWTAQAGQSPPAGVNAQYNPAWKYMTMRPRPGDMYYVQGDPRSFPLPGDAGGDVKNLPGVPFFLKDQSGNLNRDANGNVTSPAMQNDSFWMDLNYPVQITRNGKKYKPLFAFLVLDLDGRLNLNVHGNINAQTVFKGPSGQQQIIPLQHASDQALGRYEVNISKVLTSVGGVLTPSNPMEWPQLFAGTTPTPSNGLPRYGAWPSSTQIPVAGMFDGRAVPANQNQNQYADPYLSDVQRSLVYPFDFDARDAANNLQVTQHFAFPFTNWSSYPQFSTTGYDNFTYDATKVGANPFLNPRLNHPLLNQKLRNINLTAAVVNNNLTSLQNVNDDQPFGDDNLFNVLAGDYRKSTLYGLIPNNLDGNNVPVPTLGQVVSSPAFGAKARQLISTRSYDLDAPGAQPWIVNWAPANQNDPSWTMRYECAAPAAPQTPFPFPQGARPFVTPTPAQIAAPTTLFGDYKPGDGRANLLSRVDLARKLTPFTDATGTFVQPVVPNSNPPQMLPPPNPAVLYSQLPLATNPQYRYYYAMYERQQFAKDIFDRLVKATGAVPPPSATPAPQGTLSAANGSTPQQYAATRWLAQLAVNIVDYIDEDDIITPFQWNAFPDQTLETGGQQGATMPPSAGWVFGTEAPNLLLNEAYSELQNDPADRPDINPQSAAATQGATQSFIFSFWFELLNPTPAAAPLDPAKPGPPAVRQDPNRYSFLDNKGTPMPDPNNPTQPLTHDHLATQLERFSKTLQAIYPVYQIIVADTTTLGPSGLATLMQPQANTDGWLTTGEQNSYVKIQLAQFKFGNNAHAPNPKGVPATATNYYDANFVEPSTGDFNIQQPNKLLPNQGFYVISPDQRRTFMPDAQQGPQPQANNLTPTLYVGDPNLTPPLSPQQPWGTPVAKNSVQNALSYKVQTPPTGDTTLYRTTRHSAMLRRLACPYIDPNPIDPRTGQLVNPAKPFNPYVTVDYIDNIKFNDGVKYLKKGASNQPPLNKAQTPQAQRFARGRRQPYAASLVADSQTAQPNPVNHTFFQHNAPTATTQTSSTLDFPFEWYNHLDRAPTNLAEILQVSGVRPHLLTQQFVQGTFAAAQTTVGTPTSETKFGHLAPWTDQNARIYRALEYFTVGDRSPYPGTLGRVAGKININAIFDRDMTDAIIDARAKQNTQANPPVPNPNFFFETDATKTTTATGAATDVWQGNVGTLSSPNTLSVMLSDPTNVSVRNRKQQMLGLDGVAPPAGKFFPPDRPFMSLAAPAISTNAAAGISDPQYQAPNSGGQPVDLAGIAGTILPYPVADPASQANPPATLTIGTFTPVKTAQTAGGTPDYTHSLDYTVPQSGAVKSVKPTLPPWVLDELLTKVSGHVTPRGNNFAVFITVGFFEVIDDTTAPVKLGAELTTSGGKTIRHQMFAVVDRTNLAIDAGAALDPTNPDPTGRLRQAPMPPVFMSLTDAIPAGTGAPPKQGQPPTPIMRSINGTLPTDYDGTTPVTFKPNPPPPYSAQGAPFLPITAAGWPSGTYQWMFLDSGATQEPVQVTQLMDPKTGAPQQQLLLLFPSGAQFSHPPGAPLCTYQPGNPGPQGPIDYTSPQYRAVVPYTYIIQ
jgi:hypothetical protein